MRGYDDAISSGRAECPICGRLWREAGIRDGEEIPCSDRCAEELDAREELDAEEADE